MKTKPLIEEIQEAIIKALKPIVVSRLPRSFNNSFKLNENSFSVKQDKTGDYSFYIEYNSTDKASSILRRHYIGVFIYTSNCDTNEPCLMELCDTINKSVVLQKSMKSSDELIVTYYKWLESEFDKLT